MADNTFLTPDWPAPAKVKALITTRHGGVSHGVYASNNLALHVGDEPAHVVSNRDSLQQHLGDLSPKWLRQIHSSVACEVNRDTQPDAIEADASYTHASNTVCAVLTADCLPVLLCDKTGRFVAAVHAGWRGLAAGVIESAVAGFKEPGEQLMAWLGPAIGPEHFEVGEEVKQIFEQQSASAATAFVTAGAPGKYFADLYQLATLRLRAMGVTVFGGGLCTYANEDFYSYRRDGTTGRFASLIWIED